MVDLTTAADPKRRSRPPLQRCFLSEVGMEGHVQAEISNTPADSGLHFLLSRQQLLRVRARACVRACVCLTLAPERVVKLPAVIESVISFF